MCRTSQQQRKTESWRVQVTIELGFELGSSDPRPHVPRASWPSVSLGFRSSQPYTEGTESLPFHFFHPSISFSSDAFQIFLFGISRVGSVFLFGYKRDKRFILASNFKCNSKGSFLVVQWLGLNAFTAVAWVQYLIGELKSCKPSSVPLPPKKVTLRGR